MAVGQRAISCEWKTLKLVWMIVPANCTCGSTQVLVTKELNDGTIEGRCPSCQVAFSGFLIVTNSVPNIPDGLLDAGNATPT